jgi:hypothetical protein
VIIKNFSLHANEKVSSGIGFPSSKIVLISNSLFYLSVHPAILTALYLMIIIFLLSAALGGELAVP